MDEDNWHGTTYLIVKCTKTDGNTKLHYYTNYNNSHEKIFMDNLDNLEYEAIELYANYTPCKICSVKLLETFGGTGLTINAVAIYYEDDEDAMVKLKHINDKGILIKPLGKEQFFELIPQEYRDALTLTLQNCNGSISSRDRHTACRLLEIL